MPAGSNLRISSTEALQGRMAEKTCCSRMRRAMSCVYCPPKSRTTTPPRSVSMAPPCSSVCRAAVSIKPPVSGYDEIHEFIGHNDLLHDALAVHVLLDELLLLGARDEFFLRSAGRDS